MLTNDLEELMDKIFIIKGEHSEYEDRVFWNVAAFTDEQLCKDYMERLNQWLVGCHISKDPGEYQNITPKLPFIDPQLEQIWQGYGVEYSIEELTIVSDINQKLT